MDVRSKGSENEKGPPSEEDDDGSPTGSPKLYGTIQSNPPTEKSFHDLKHDESREEKVYCSYISQSSCSDIDSDQEVSEMADKMGTLSVSLSNQQSIAMPQIL